MVPARRPRFLAGGEALLLVFVVLFPLGPRFASAVGNIYLGTVLTIAWLAAWTVFVFAGPTGGLSLATTPQKALFAYAGFLVLQVFFHIGGLVERPASLFRAIQLLAYMGLFVTISSLRIDSALPGRLARVSFGVLAVECVLAWLPGGTSPQGFLSGTFDREHNSFASYLILMLCLLVAHLSFTKPGAGRVALAVLGAATIVCLAFSFSRTAYVAAPAGVLALVHRRWGKRAFFRCLLVLGLVVLIGAAVAPPEIRDRFSSIFHVASGEDSDLSFMTRLALWRHATADLVRTGFLGVGIFGYKVIDNYYVRALAETGPIGLGLFLWFLGAILLWLYRVYARETDPEIRALALGLYGSTVGLLLVTNLAGDIFLLHRVMGVYWVLLGSFVSMQISRGRLQEKD